MSQSKQSTQTRPGEEENLLKHLADDGVEQYFESLYNMYADRLYTFAYKILKSPVYDSYGEAQDVVQEALMNAYTALSGYSSERIEKMKLSAWLYRITLNEALKIIKKRRPVQSTSLDHSEEGVSLLDNIKKALYNDETPEKILVHNEGIKKIIKAIQDLRSPYREVAFLFLIEEMSIEDICKKLGRSESAVKTHNRRAKLLLRQALES